MFSSKDKLIRKDDEVKNGRSLEEFLALIDKFDFDREGYEKKMVKDFDALLFGKKKLILANIEVIKNEVIKKIITMLRSPIYSQVSSVHAINLFTEHKLVFIDDLKKSEYVKSAVLDLLAKETKRFGSNSARSISEYFVNLGIITKKDGEERINSIKVGKEL